MFHAWCTEWCYSFYNYEKWFEETSKNSEIARVGYEIKYKLSFEPYYIGRTNSTPFYDTRFQGYGYNKVIQCYEAALQNYSFKVLTSVWLTHDGIKNETTGSGADQQAFNQKLFNLAKKELKSKYALLKL
ncbi:Oidioi.mRNA.OKI2018_I69.chr2.g6573.t1.cds [Oikopleura dioica]|uniref:Beta-1,4-glucuronyltransferase 1 n=1 Tax=Oikopleura dioica TaxID=34765 RepID=A0ABN7T7B1_OIKDI|nr:Oidioi.mRNA.OKI2018_I69.chr2.g6573.t1.cds [Oikopleura dioica]